jgi:glycerol kinase
MQESTGLAVSKLKVDGGASSNNLMLQFQSDILGVPLERPKCVETTALGAAYLAGLAVGFWKELSDLTDARQIDCAFTSTMDDQTREKLLRGWHKAVERSKDWEE